MAAGVAAIFIGLRPSARPVQHPQPQQRLAIVRNYPNRALPPLAGEFSCGTDLLPPRVDRPASTPYDCYITHVNGRPSRGHGSGPRGIATINVGELGGLVFSLDVSGLPRSPLDGDYAVWLLPGGQNAAGIYGLVRGARPKLIGIVTPPVGATGRLRAQGVDTHARAAAGNRQLSVRRHSAGRFIRRLPRADRLEGWLSF